MTPVAVAVAVAVKGPSMADVKRVILYYAILCYIIIQ